MRIHKHQIFLAMLYGVVYGIAIYIFFAQNLTQLFLWGGILLLVLCASSMRTWHWWIITIAVIMGGMIGVWRAQQSLVWLASPNPLIGQEVTWSAVIDGDVRESIYDKRAVVSLRSCHDAHNNIIDCNGVHTLIKTNKYTNNMQLRWGIRGTCTFVPVENFSEDFDYRMYLAKSGVRSMCVAQNIEHIQLTQMIDRSYYQLMRIRYQMEQHLAQSVPQPEGALATGLLFGGDERLSEQIQQQFARTGLTHIVAVSGFNVTVIAQYLVLLGIMLGLWRQQATWLAIIGIFAFVAIIGFPTPAVRAGVMGILVLLVMRAGRVGQAIPAVVFAGVTMILYNPLIIRYDIGFQLSFLATLGIILLYPLFERWFVRGSSVLFIWEIFFLTVSAQIFVVPILAYHFGVISIISLVTNILVLPIIPIAMAIAFLVAIVGYVSISGATLLGGVLYMILAYVFGIVEYFAQLSWAVKDITMTVWVTVVFYIILGIVIAILRKIMRDKCGEENDKTKKLEMMKQ